MYLTCAFKWHVKYINAGHLHIHFYKCNRVNGLLMEKFDFFQTCYANWYKCNKEYAHYGLGSNEVAFH